MTDIQSRTERLRSALMEAGTCLAGFADLSCLDVKVTRGYRFGIGFALQYDLDAVDSLPDGELFLEMGATLSKKAGEIYAIIRTFLDGWGYGYARVSSGAPAEELPDLREELPQKTIATLAGLGWIGRSSLLVSFDYGPRIRLGAMLTDGSFQADNPLVDSNCNDCKSCVDACPVGAIKGVKWSQGVDRADLLDAKLCYDYRGGETTTIGLRHVCGLCLRACPIGK